MPKALTAPPIEDLIDRSYQLAQQIAQLEELQKQVRGEILAELAKKPGLAVKAARATAQIRTSTVPQIADEQAFFRWASLKANRDVLKVGVVTDAWKARTTSGVKVPGVESFTRETLYVTANKA